MLFTSAHRPALFTKLFLLGSLLCASGRVAVADPLNQRIQQRRLNIRNADRIVGICRLRAEARWQSKVPDQRPATCGIEVRVYVCTARPPCRCLWVDTLKTTQDRDSALFLEGLFLSMMGNCAHSIRTKRRSSSQLPRQSEGLNPRVSC